MQIPDKPLRLIKFLQEKIHGGEFPGGSKLPSIRILMAQFNLSYGSVKRGIDYLAGLGLVEKLPGRGVFVKQRRKSATAGQARTSIAVFLPNNPVNFRPGIYPTVLLGVQAAAAEMKISLLLNYVSIADLTPKNFQSCTAGCHGVLLLGEYDPMAPELPVPIPVAGVCMDNSAGGRISVVDLDPFSAAEQAVKFFARRKLTTVKVIIDKRAAYTRRGEVFADTWRQAGNHAELTQARTPITFNRDTGYFFATGSILQEASEQYEKATGHKLADDFTVLSLDGKCLINPDYHRAPAIALDWESAGRYAMEECLYRIDHPGSIPKRIYLPGKLV